MNSPSSFILVILALALTAGTVTASLSFSEHQDWKFIQAVGGMKVSLNEKQLVVDCDVSGLCKVTTKPTLVNSMIGVKKLNCSRSGQTIHLSVVTDFIQKGMKTKCGNADLSKYPSGTYKVVYLNPDGTTIHLNSISLPK